MKTIVFDFDETLGHFGELGAFIGNLQLWFKSAIKRDFLYSLLDMYPFVFRSDLFKILNLVKKLKKRGDIGKVIIYTNNMAPRGWVLSIKKYLELKLNFPLFDRVISAWKIDNKVIESKRTSHDKSYGDLIRCANLSNKTKVLFFDDQEHSIMNHPNVAAVHLIPYTYIMNGRHMVDRFLYSKFGKLIRRPIIFQNFMKSKMKSYWNIQGGITPPLPKNEYQVIDKVIKKFITV